MNDHVIPIRSALPGVVWPGVPGPEATALLALQFQLDRSQWLPFERLRELQFRQLGVLLGHAYGTVPYYRERWRGLYDPAERLTPEAFARIPLITRAEVQAAFDALKSSGAVHGPTQEARTSGSTGVPVRVLRTALSELWWNALTMRDHLWHRRDLGGKLAAIRHKAVEGEGEGWGQATNLIVSGGRSATLPIDRDVDMQLDWLVRQQPDYLMTYPSNVGELIRRSAERGTRFPRLREVRTFGEAVGDQLREDCREIWGVPVTDLYSSNEAGYMALQCPERAHYHVQSESVLIEILDEAGRPCEAGQSGRVVVTDLHNFAMPLVRYDLGDYAEVGEPCGCGRGLPVLSRIHGRVRNMLVFANGRRYWPSFGQRSFTDIAPVLQHKFVQRDFSVIEAQLVTSRALSEGEEEKLRRHILSKLPGHFDLKIVYCAEIPRSASGKFEDFSSDLADFRPSGSA